jgi:hypothetical protein
LRSQRARAGGQKSAVAQVLPGVSVTVHATGPAELQPAEVEARLRACGGAHPPDSYRF